MLNKIIIGSANFGMSYGIVNKKKLQEDLISKIITKASREKIWGIDTASGYGNAEKIIGKYINHSSLKIITKLPNKRYINEEEVIKEVKNSLRRLNANQIEILLIHNFNNFKKDKNSILKGIQKLINVNLIKKWGVSVYYPHQVKYLLKKGYKNFVVEFPLNLFDRRFTQNGFLKELKEKDCFLIVRSVFLQGLFVLDTKNLKGNVVKCKNHIQSIQKISTTYKIPIPILALLFVLNQKYVDKVIIGVDTLEQFAENLSIHKYLNIYKNLIKKVEKLQLNDENILLPFKWKFSS